MTRLLPLSALAAFALAGCATDAAAAEPPSSRAPARVHLSYWQGPGAGGCMSASELESAVEQRLGRGVFADAAQAELVVELRAARRGREFVIGMQLFDRERHRIGKRQLTTRARHCSALDDSLALVFSLAVDLTAASVSPPSPATATPAPLPPALETPLEVPSSTLAPREGPRVRPSIGVVMNAGLMPHVGVGLRAKLEVELARFWPIWVAASVWHDQRAGSTSGAEFSLQALQFGACPGSLEWGNLQLALCAEQLLGREHSVGFGYDQGDTNDAWFAAFGPAVELEYWVGQGFVSLEGELLAPLGRRRYFFSDGVDTTLYETSWLQAGLGFAAGFEF